MKEMTVRLHLVVLSRTGEVVCEACGTDGVSLMPPRPWRPGDSIVLWTNVWPLRLRLEFDRMLAPTEVWLMADRMDFPIPYGKGLEAYPPGAFSGKRPGEVHVCRVPAPQGRYVLSENPLDRRGETTYFPHCTASAETRGEAVFAARNTIDGVCENTCHGEWPYQSWGDDENPYAEIMVEFGRLVRVDGLRVWLRADFPHDNWWRRARLLFSDGSSKVLSFEKTKEAQEFSFAPRTVSWVKLTRLEKDADDPSPFPALTQWALLGYEK